MIIAPLADGSRGHSRSRASRVRLRSKRVSRKRRSWRPARGESCRRRSGRAGVRLPKESYEPRDHRIQLLRNLQLMEVPRSHSLTGNELWAELPQPSDVGRPRAGRDVEEWKAAP